MQCILFIKQAHSNGNSILEQNELKALSYSPETFSRQKMMRNTFASRQQSCGVHWTNMSQKDASHTKNLSEFLFCQDSDFTVLAHSLTTAEKCSFPTENFPPLVSANFFFHFLIQFPPAAFKQRTILSRK